MGGTLGAVRRAAMITPVKIACPPLPALPDTRHPDPDVTLATDATCGTLDVTPLDRAVSRLREGLQRYDKDITDDQVRDGLIQRFKFTYELSHKLLKRFLENSSDDPAEYDRMTFQELIRIGNERGLLLNGWSAWREFRGMRAMAGRCGDEDSALRIVAGIPGFLAEANFLLAHLSASPWVVDGN